ncbi:MAG: hypothetical protein M1158_02145 [Candidatus Marsarchaeota archaeon]|nr:hypothetical protein [Candidatus Marsarchaeota archaeon]
MHLEFIIDKEYDAKISLMRRTAKSREQVEERYKSDMGLMLVKKDEYQKSWDQINDDFSDYVERMTGYKWLHPEYECVLSCFNRGISNWGMDNRIVRSWTEDQFKMRRITAHELILMHYFEIYKENYVHEGLTEGQVWALAEIAAFALTSLTKEAELFWPGDTEYHTDHNYPHIVELQNELKQVFLDSIKKSDFDHYMKVGINLVKKYPNMNPKGK